MRNHWPEGRNRVILDLGKNMNYDWPFMVSDLEWKPAPAPDAEVQRYIDRMFFTWQDLTFLALDPPKPTSRTLDSVLQMRMQMDVTMARIFGRKR